MQASVGHHHSCVQIGNYNLTFTVQHLLSFFRFVQQTIKSPEIFLHVYMFLLHNSLLMWPSYIPISSDSLANPICQSVCPMSLCSNAGNELFTT